MGYRRGGLLLGGYKVGGGEDADAVHFIQLGARDGVNDADGIHLVPEELYPDRLVAARREDVHHIAPDPEVAARELRLGSVVEGVHEAVEQAGEAASLASGDLDRLGVEVFRVSDAVKAGYR